MHFFDETQNHFDNSHNVFNDAHGDEDIKKSAPNQEGVSAFDDQDADAPVVHDIQEVQRALKDAQENLLRALADQENLRRRHQRELDDGRKYAIQSFAREMLAIADNLERALETVKDAERSPLIDGVDMTQKELQSIFQRHHITPILPVVGEAFDHDRHQAMLEVPAHATCAPGHVAQVMQRGYALHGRLLRPAMVAVAKNS